MKRWIIRVITLAVTTAASFTAVDDAVAQNGNAQQQIPEEYRIVGNANKDTLIVKVLYDNAPNYFGAPDMPRFAIIGKERKFYLGIGGYIKASLSYDFGDPIDNAGAFVTSAIPMDNPAGNGSLFQMNASATNMFFNFVALPHTKDQIGGYINFNFNGGGNNYGFSLKAAYITYRGFILGFNTTLFTDGAASAPTIDQQGPNSMAFLFNTVLDYQHQFNKHWRVGVGLELPVVNATYNDGTYAINQRVPDIPFYLQYSWAEGKGWLRMSGIVRNMIYQEKGVGRRDGFGYGVKASGAIPFGSKVTIYYQGVYGSGIANYIQDIQGCGYDMVPAAMKEEAFAPGVYQELDNGLVTPDVWGFYAGVQYQLSTRMFTSATYSTVQLDLPLTESGSAYKGAQYAVANIFYNLTPSVRTGIEYIWGSRENLNGEVRHNSRVQTAVRVNF